MNRQIPKLGFRNTSAPLSRTFLKGITHLAVPVVTKDDRPTIGISKKLRHEIENVTGLNLAEEFSKFDPSFLGKVGELAELPLQAEKNKLSRILFIGVGNSSVNDLRKAGAALGRKVKATPAKLFSFCPTNRENALAHLISLAVSTYSWSEKSTTSPEVPNFFVDEQFEDVLTRAEVLISGTWRTRDLVHTPANIATPEWVANQARKLARENGLSITVKSGRELSEFGGLRAVGNSSTVHPPRMVEITYSPRGSRKGKQRIPHVVLVGKGITFDTGGVSLKRPYDLMIPMKTDMSGSAAVLMTAVCAAQLKLNVKVTSLLMLAENALSATSQRPSDVITHYGGTTVEVIDTDAEGRLVLADGLAYADMNLEPDYLIDVATLTGSATLGLSRYYGAMYTRHQKVAHALFNAGELMGERVWHMPLVDDYAIALESDTADFNHAADKYAFQGGSITAALFLENFVGERRWVHLDIAGTARSDVDAGENPKGGTGFGVRLLTEWLSTL